MGCGHAFCNDCWHQHFDISIREGKSRRLRCMAPKCGAVCDEDKVALGNLSRPAFHTIRLLARITYPTPLPCPAHFRTRQ